MVEKRRPNTAACRQTRSAGMVQRKLATVQSTIAGCSMAGSTQCVAIFARSTAGLILLAAKSHRKIIGGGTRKKSRLYSMARIEFNVPGVQHFRSRYGKWYAYHRATRKRIKAPFGTAAFLAEVEALNATAAANATVRDTVAPGSLGALIQDYKQSPEFTNLAPRTRDGYRAVLDYLQPLISTTRSSISTPAGSLQFAMRRSKNTSAILLIGRCRSCRYCSSGAG